MDVSRQLRVLRPEIWFGLVVIAADVQFEPASDQVERVQDQIQSFVKMSGASQPKDSSALAGRRLPGSDPVGVRCWSDESGRRLVGGVCAQRPFIADEENLIRKDA